MMKKIVNIDLDEFEESMSMQELEKIMIEYGIVLRAIPLYHTSTYEVRHKDHYPEGVEYFDPRFKRNMLKVKKANYHGGKFIITRMTDTVQTIPFYKPRYFDSIEEAVNAFLAEMEEEKKQHEI